MQGAQQRAKCLVFVEYMQVVMGMDEAELGGRRESERRSRREGAKRAWERSP